MPMMGGPMGGMPGGGRGIPMMGGGMGGGMFGKKEEKKMTAGLSAAKVKSIGVLDIYGFEIFDVNGFEQFCINYVNERLQQVFIDLTLRLEQQEYHDEGMNWKDIDFFNNKIVVDVIEEYPTGVFYCLDDVALLAGAEGAEKADKAFLTKVDKNYPKHPHLTMNTGGFKIEHYAGPVNYTCSDFVSKNKNNLQKEIVEQLRGSTNPFVVDMFPETRKKASTSATLIRSSAKKLMDTLSVCVPYYIRCIKSNDTRSALDFNTARVKHQVTYLGLAENIRIKKAGYSYRHYFQNFVQRFGPICQEITKTPNQDPMTKQETPIIYGLSGPLPTQDQNGCQQIIEAFKKTLIDPKTNSPRVDELGAPLAPWAFDKDQYGYGKSKIFVKSPETIFMLDDELHKRVNPAEYEAKQKEFAQVAGLANKNRKGNMQGLQPGGGCVLL